jgi:hypothetical protein
MTQLSTGILPPSVWSTAKIVEMQTIGDLKGLNRYFKAARAGDPKLRYPWPEGGDAGSVGRSARLYDSRQAR